MSSEDELKILREEINRVTAEIIRLCAVRLSLAAKTGEIKLTEGLPIESPKVEQELKQTVVQNCRLHGIDSQFGLGILKLLLEESKRLQRDLMK